MDRAGLRNYVNINPAARTLDDFIEALVDAGFIDQEVTERCDLEASFTVTGNVQVSLSAKTEDDSEFCHLASEQIANEINNLSTTSSTQTDASQVAQVPELLQFASAAVAAPNLLEERIPNGAPVLAVFSSYTLLLLVVLIYAIP